MSEGLSRDLQAVLNVIVQVCQQDWE